jgi:D-erythrulose 1-phosphate 3-epimerase
MSHRLGINTCFAVKRWPRPDEWAAVVREELGLDLVQHSLDLVDPAAPAGGGGGPAARVGGGGGPAPRVGGGLAAGAGGGPAAWGAAATDPHGLGAQADAVRDACAANRLALGSVFTGLAAYSTSMLLHPDAAARDRAREWLEAVIGFAARAGARTVGGHVGCLPVGAARGTGLAALRPELARLAAGARAAGLEALLFENMACAREPSTMADARLLLGDGVRLCLDVGHMCVPGTTGDDRDPYAWLRELGGEAAMVHLQQSDAEADHHWPFTAAYPGRIDPPRVLEALAEGGAGDVDLVLEVIHPFEADERQVLSDLRESVEVWQTALGQ